ncbi:MAG: exodeoxyribonuclease V subunit beta, partial [Desulfobulbales bacterium]
TRMDEAAIYTIHSFCQRMLQDHAFESGVPFTLDFIESEQLLRSEIVEDFWRQRFYSASPEETAWALKNWQGPEQLAITLQGFLSRPLAECVPGVSVNQVTQDKERTLEAFHRVKDSWRNCSGEVKEILDTDPCLSHSRDGYRAEQVEKIMAGMESLVTAKSMPWILPPKVDLLVPAIMAGKLKGRRIIPDHPFFRLFDEFYTSHTEFSRKAKVFTIEEANRYLRSELILRKQVQGKMYFDDLLTRFAGALGASGGPKLVQRIRSRFKVAVVDEFQDTDPLQYRIFYTLFGQKSDPNLFMIGDPKQSIYSFRGADIFAYIRARNDTQPTSCYTMDTNYRSSSAMVRIVNRLFDREASFVYSGEIDFHCVYSSGKADGQPLTIQESVPSPLQVQLLPVEGHSAPNKKTIAKDRAAGAAARWTALEIARLLGMGRRGEAKIGKDSLAGGDLAILVRTHREADLMQNELRRMKIGCVYYSQESVYGTDEARQLLVILTALLDLSVESQVCNALVTDLFGFTASKLHTIRADQKEWSAMIAELEEYHYNWRNSGITAMFYALLIRRKIVGRLLAMSGGERKLTNFLHLLELLQDVSAKYRLDDLVRWFNHQMHRPSPEASSQQLRLETDENLVKIVTIHKAKGLEFPIVFLPFLWSARQIKNNEVFSFHETGTSRLLVDIGSGKEENYQQAEKERLAEDLRLLYVALTRGRYCCYMVWGRINLMEKSALAWLLHREADKTMPTAAEMEEERIIRDIDILNDGEKLVHFVPLPVGYDEETVETVPPRPSFAARSFSGRIDGGWSISSYSKLAATSAPGSYMVGSTDIPVAPGAPGAAVSVFTFPKGPVAGNCLHSLLEALDFAILPAVEVHDLIVDRLMKAGIDVLWAPLVYKWIEHIMETRLTKDFDLRLKLLKRQDRLSEMGFYFPLPNLDLSTFNDILESFGFEPVDVSPSSLQGLMKGYIDLIFYAGGRFYIVDYKSNYLGPDYPAYGREPLQEAMREHRYDLQYLIYSVALHRYLGSRMCGYDYSEHFGGVFYLFLRGMHPQHGPESGIWYDYPARELIERLDVCFGRRKID